MPVKKTTSKKNTKVTAQFSANVPEGILKECCKQEQCGGKKHRHKKGGTGAIYGLGLIGAAIYFISTATGFRIGVLGLLKAFVRPVFLVYGALKYLGM